ncbi:uncharacterized protein LOC26526114 isoform X5 [Drosophila erecta]|uniref:uncharacterized protein LOC113564134 isoform X5 n=1 Tax=Drosophila erecta TaxID=7220 RepID=UPI000F0588DA|nr:uncharacterized protein LOC113564134 isoform X5 [Drosophila erecta]XP_026835249.1 uncharacterized protein LOC26526114 isoform X5 [Drosophila erecta]
MILDLGFQISVLWQEARPKWILCSMQSPGCSGVIEQGPANTSAVEALLSVSTGARDEFGLGF